MPLTPLLSSNSDETNWNNLNNMLRDTYARETIEIYKDDTGTPVVVLDKNGLRTTTPGSGVNVLTAAESEYTFDSNRQTLRLLQDEGFIVTTSLLTTGTQATFTKTVSFNQAVLDFIATGLTPIILAFNINGGYWSGVQFNSFVLSGAGTSPGRVLIYSFTTTGTNVTFSVQALNGNGASWTPLTETGNFLVLAQASN